MTKEVVIKPITKIKRILLFLGDFCLNFVLSFSLFNLVVAPLGEVMTGYNNKVREKDTATRSSLDVLYGHKLLKYNTDEPSYTLETDLDITGNCFLSYYVTEEESLYGSNLYGHKQDNEVCKHYFIDIKNDSETYYSTFVEFNDAFNYFDINGETITLKDEYKELFLPFFDSNNSLSKNGETELNDFKNKFFLNFYSRLVNDIKENDLAFNNISYKDNIKKIDNFNKYFQNVMTVSAIIAFVISSFVLFFIIPMFVPGRRTLMMLILKVRKVGFNNLYEIRRYELIWHSLFNMFTNMGILIFLPIILLSLIYLLSLALLIALSLVAVMICLLGLILILSNQHNRSITDICSNTVVISNDDFEIVLMEKANNGRN